MFATDSAAAAACCYCCVLFDSVHCSMNAPVMVDVGDETDPLEVRGALMEQQQQGLGVLSEAESVAVTARHCAKHQMKQSALAAVALHCGGPVYDALSLQS